MALYHRNHWHHISEITKYNSRLGLGLNKVEDILFHMAKHGLTMVRKYFTTEREDWLDVGWKGENGLWLGKSKRIIRDSNTHVSMVKTFINDSLIHQNQDAVLDDDTLEKLLMFELNIGGDAYAQGRVS